MPVPATRTVRAGTPQPDRVTSTAAMPAAGADRSTARAPACPATSGAGAGRRATATGTVTGIASRWVSRLRPVTVNITRVPGRRGRRSAAPPHSPWHRSPPCPAARPALVTATRAPPTPASTGKTSTPAASCPAWRTVSGCGAAVRTCSEQSPKMLYCSTSWRPSSPGYTSSTFMMPCWQRAPISSAAPVVSRSTTSSCITVGGTHGVVVEALYMAMAPAGRAGEPVRSQASAKHSASLKRPLAQLTSMIHGLRNPLSRARTSAMAKGGLPHEVPEPWPR